MGETVSGKSVVITSRVTSMVTEMVTSVVLVISMVTSVVTNVNGELLWWVRHSECDEVTRSCPTWSEFSDQLTPGTTRLASSFFAFLLWPSGGQN